MDEQLIETIWVYSILTAAAVWAFLLLGVLSGFILKKKQLLKISIKYFINSTLAFSLVFPIRMKFALAVNARYRSTREETMDLLHQWVKTESLDWLLWALALTTLLALFNKFYQERVEKIVDTQQLVILSVINVLVITYGILLGAYQALISLTEEINQHFQ